MELTSISSVASMPLPAAEKPQVDEAGREFEAMFYRTMLQGVRWSTGLSGGTEHAVIGGMLNDLLAQEMTRQQSGFGAMLFRLMEQGGGEG